MLLLSLALSISYTEWLPATARRFEKHGVVYLPQFLPKQTFEQVRRECRSYRGALKLEKDSIANGRLGRVLDGRTVSHSTFYADSMTLDLQRILGVPAPFQPSDFPVELRHYPIASGMQWHKDDMLYEMPQCEFVFTVDNESDSYTEWEDQDTHKSVWTEPNSLIAIRAGETGPRHRVTPITRGYRTILKFVYWAGGEKADDFYTHIDSFPGARPSQRRKTLKEASIRRQVRKQRGPTQKK